MLSVAQLPSIPKAFHKQLRQRFLRAFRPQVHSHALIYMSGGQLTAKYDDDQQHYFQQESSFFYLFGVKQADCEGLIQVGSGRSTLILRRPSVSDKMWTKVLDKEEARGKYQCDAVVYKQQVQDLLKQIKPSQIHLYCGTNSDSGRESLYPKHDFLKNYTLVKEKLHWHLDEARVIKTPAELELIRFVCKTTSESLITTMQNAKPGLRVTQLSGLFQFCHTSKTCSLPQSFQPISCACQNIQHLHYHDGPQIINEGDMILNDMGGKFYGYCADQAITYSVSKTFNTQQLIIYQAVLDAQKAVKAKLKQGVDWTQMHLLAESVIIKHLKAAGILKGDAEQLQRKRVGAVFFPHGLGHFFGLNVHDVGGYNKGPARHTEFGLKSLRTRRILQAGMTITVEPGCYFIPGILQLAKSNEQQREHIDFERVGEFLKVGGVRLQDDVLITQDGYEQLSHLPRQVQQLYKCQRGQPWQS